MPKRLSIEDRTGAKDSGSYKSAPTTLAVSTGACNVTPTALSVGLYHLSANVPVNFRQVASNVATVTEANAFYLGASVVAEFAVTGDSDEFVSFLGRNDGGRVWLVKR